MLRIVKKFELSCDFTNFREVNKALFDLDVMCTNKVYRGEYQGHKVERVRFNCECEATKFDEIIKYFENNNYGYITIYM